jgi:hypothetical protein
MKKKANCTKVKVLSKDYIFNITIFYWFILHFSHLKKTKYQIWGQIWHIKVQKGYNEPTKYCKKNFMSFLPILFFIWMNFGTIFLPHKNFLRVLSYQVFAFAHVLQFFMLLRFLLFFASFQVHSFHSCCNTHYKRQICCGPTSNVKKLHDHSLLLFFHLG